MRNSPMPDFEISFTPALERLQREVTSLVSAAPVFVLALVVVVLAWMLGRWLSKRAFIDRVGRYNPFMQELARTSVRWLVLALGVLVALEILDATALAGAILGTAGVLGVALGFAFKDILENYLAGILMSIRQPFSPRDHVVIDGNEGIVASMTSRATILVTLDGNHLRLPNALVFRSVTLNYTRNPSRRFQFDVGIGVNEDLLRAQAIGIEAIASLEGVLDTPPPRAFIASLGDSNVQVRFLGWVDQRSHDFAAVKSEAIRLAKTALEAAGMDMPEPIYRLQLQSFEAAPSSPAHAPSRGVVTDGEAAVDTRARDEIGTRIELERAMDPSTRGRDLLDETAPRE